MSEPAGGGARPLAAIAFDFDGVIVESGPIKQRAFLELFADRPELAPAILAHHRRHLGVSRYDKLAWIHRELLGRPLAADELEALGYRYSHLVVEQVVACPLVPGAGSLLRELAGRVHCFVVSATPQAELERIVERRGLGAYFRELHGTPGAKADTLAGLMAAHRLSPDELMMVGDGLSDYQAARAAGIEFILRQTPEQEELFRGIEVERVADLAELGRRLAPRLPRLAAAGGGETAP